MLKTTTSVAVALGALVALSAPAMAQDCKPAHEFDTVEKGFITVAPGTYPPYAYVDADGVLQGIDGDIVKHIAKMECLEVKAIPVDPAAALQYVISGKADMTVGDWYRTEARARVTNLSDPLYLDQMAVYSKSGIDSVDQMMDMTVGVTQGNLWNEDAKKVFGEKLKIYPVAPAALKDLENGRIDVVLDGYSVGLLAKQKGALEGIEIKVIKPDERIAASMEAGQGAFPMNKKNEGLLTAVNEDIATMKSDGSMVKILENYGLDASAIDTGAPRLIK